MTNRKKVLKRMLCFMLVSCVLILSAFRYQKTNENYQTLSNLEWNDDLKEIYPLVKGGADLYAQEIKGEFQPIIDETSNFPKELLYRMEEALYNYCNDSVQIVEDIFQDDEEYAKIIQKMGGDKYGLNYQELYELFPQAYENRKDFLDIYDVYKFVSGHEECIDMFQLEWPGKEDVFLLVLDSGGSRGECGIEIVQRTDDSWVTLEVFQANGNGAVIGYEDDLYYVTRLYNFNIQEYDGFCLYKLPLESKVEKLSIWYLPVRYVWKEIYSDFLENEQAEFESELDTYLEEIKDEIVQNQYLENGLAKDINIFKGDEEEIQTDNGTKYYKADFANIGVPISFVKSNKVSYGYQSRWYLEADFWLGDMETGSSLQFENLQIGGSAPFENSLKLVQMWFKEITGRTVTFRVYHISDYNYLLNVVLIEGDETKQIRNYIFASERQFVLGKNDGTEG